MQMCTEKKNISNNKSASSKAKQYAHFHNRRRGKCTQYHTKKKKYQQHLFRLLVMLASFRVSLRAIIIIIINCNNYKNTRNENRTKAIIMANRQKKII